MNFFDKLNKNKFGKIFKYSLIKYIALAFGFLKSILNAKVLGPELLGILGNLTLVLGYCVYANLGIIYSMNREYVLYEDDNHKKAKEVLDTSFTFLILVSIIFILLSIVSLAFYRNEYGIYLCLIFIIGIFDQFKSYFINYFRLKDNYKMINSIEIVYNIVSFIITLLFIFRLKILGVLLSMLICGIIILILGIRKSENIELKLNKYILKNLINLGIPLLIYNLGFYILTTIDRWVIIKYYSNEELGYYTFSNSMVTATLVFITSLLFLLYPKVIKLFNETKSNGIIKKVNAYSELLEVASIVFFILGLVVYEPFVKIVMPQYNSSIVAYIILLLSIILNNISYFANCYLVSNKKQKYLVYLQIISIILNMSLNLIFVRLGFGIAGVAVGTMVTNLIYSILQYSLFIKENMKKINFLYIFKRYYRIAIFSLSITIIVLFKSKYVIYIVSSIMIAILLYIGEKENIKENLKVINEK